MGNRTVRAMVTYRRREHRKAIGAASAGAGADSHAEWLRAVWAHFSGLRPAPPGYLRPRRTFEFGEVEDHRWVVQVMVDEHEREAHAKAAARAGLSLTGWRLVVADVAAGISALAEQLRGQPELPKAVAVTVEYRNERHKVAVREAAEAAGAETPAVWLRAVWTHLAGGRAAPDGYLRPVRGFDWGPVEGHCKQQVRVTEDEHELHRRAAARTGLSVSGWRGLTMNVCAGISDLAEQFEGR